MSTGVVIHGEDYSVEERGSGSKVPSFVPVN